MLVGFRLRLFTLAESWATCPPPAGRWALTARPTTASSAGSTAGGWRRSTSVSVGGRGCPTRSARTSSNGSSPSRLAHPGYGPRRISAELAREKWGGLRISEHGIWRVLVRVGLNTRTKRLALIARHRDPYERKPDASRPSVTSTPRGRARRSSSTASTWGGYRAPRAPSGNTPRSTSPHAYAGPSCTAPSATPRARHTRELLHRVAVRARRRGLEAQRSHHRQRLGVPRQRLRRRRRASSARANASSAPAGPTATAASNASN